MNPLSDGHNFKQFNILHQNNNRVQKTAGHWFGDSKQRTVGVEHPHAGRLRAQWFGDVLGRQRIPVRRAPCAPLVDDDGG